MEFLIQPAQDQNDSTPELRTARGADPQVRVPQQHFLRLVSGLPWQLSQGGGLVQVPDSIALSWVEGILGSAFRIHPNDSGTARTAAVLTHGIRPSAFERVLSQLLAEPEPIRLNNTLQFDSPSHAASSVKEAVARLDPARLSPAYTLRPGDLFAVETSVGQGSWQVAGFYSRSNRSQFWGYGSSQWIYG